jgi:CAAX protease family protein
LVLWLPVLGKWIDFPFALSIATFGPTLSALITHRIYAGSWRFARLWTTVLDFAIGIASGTLVVLIAAFTAAFFMTESGISRWQWSSLEQIVILFLPNLLGGPLGEEGGWRGYALPRLQRRFNPATSSIILGFLWANWHLPLIVTHVYNVTWWQFVLLTIAASIFLTFTFNISNGNILSAIAVHGVYNVGTGIILNDLIAKAKLYSNPVQHNVLWISYGGVAALLCVVSKGRLGLRTQRSSIESLTVS